MLLSNAIDIFAVVSISLAAVLVQIFMHELPCPLCLLQRIGIMAIGFGYLMNIMFGNRIVHYAYSTLAAVITLLIAIRQILLHIVPGSGYYGDAIFGLHLYSWVFVICILVIIWNTLIITMYPDEVKHEHLLKNIKIEHNKIIKFLVLLYLFSILLNVILTFLECGVSQCPEDPISYFLIDKINSII
jgi:hypothetical protein